MSGKDDKVRETVLEARKEGKVCMWVLPGEMQIAPLDEFVRQPADGILYDLNRLEECALSDGGIRWVNDFAVALTIRKLVEQRDQLERENLELRHDLDRAMANHNADLNSQTIASEASQPAPKWHGELLTAWCEWTGGFITNDEFLSVVHGLVTDNLLQTTASYVEEKSK